MPAPVMLHLEPDHPQRLAASQGDVLRVMAGIVWLTEPDGDDVFLRAGDVWQLRGGCHVLIEALRGPAAAVLEPVAAANRASTPSGQRRLFTNAFGGRLATGEHTPAA